MGTILSGIFDHVANYAGMKGRMRLAVKTGVSKIRAGEIEDSEEIIAKFKTAAEEILGKPLSNTFDQTTGQS